MLNCHFFQAMLFETNEVQSVLVQIKNMNVVVNWSWYYYIFLQQTVSYPLLYLGLSLRLNLLPFCSHILFRSIRG